MYLPSSRRPCISDWKAEIWLSDSIFVRCTQLLDVFEISYVMDIGLMMAHPSFTTPSFTRIVAARASIKQLVIMARFVSKILYIKISCTASSTSKTILRIPTIQGCPCSTSGLRARSTRAATRSFAHALTTSLQAAGPGQVLKFLWRVCEIATHVHVNRLRACRRL